MGRIADSTYRALATRFQRGGTQVKTVVKPGKAGGTWAFEVSVEASPDIKVLVEVSENRLQKVGVTVSGLLGPSPVHLFESPVGNAPSLDHIVAAVGSALNEKIALKSRSIPSESFVVPPAPKLAPEPAPEPVVPARLLKPNKRSRWSPLAPDRVIEALPE
jgi:hypothetical protein